MPELASAAAASESREAAIAVLSRASGLPLAEFKPEHVERQIGRAIAGGSAETAEDLARVIARDAGARRRFRTSVAVSVSRHLRDPEQFALLEREVIPAILERPGTVRIWSVGCADGSELYDLGALLERQGALGRSLLLGSDILEENLRRAAAKQGPEASPEIRARVRWEERDVVNDPASPGNWRLILCRNMAIYLRPEARDALHRKLAGALGRGGFLMLGRSERISAPESLGLTAAAASLYWRAR